MITTRARLTLSESGTDALGQVLQNVRRCDELA
jgi:hypothetical protein